MRDICTCSCRAVVLICCAITVWSGVAARGEEPAGAWRFSAEQLQPFWRTTTMYGESILFLERSDGELPRAALLFTPTRILSVCSSSGEVKYEEGKDYSWKPGSKEVLLPKGSRIVCKIAPRPAPTGRVPSVPLDTP